MSTDEGHPKAASGVTEPGSPIFAQQQSVTSSESDLNVPAGGVGIVSETNLSLDAEHKDQESPNSAGSETGERGSVDSSFGRLVRSLVAPDDFAETSAVATEPGQPADGSFTLLFFCSFVV